MTALPNQNSSDAISIEQSTERFRILGELNELHLKLKDLKAGNVADYIPELAKQNPDHFGICVVMRDGQIYEVGDCNVPFTLQSASKPFLYGMALEDHGREVMEARIGVEPSGDSFNSITLDEKSNRPLNPMVNAGAIACTSMIKGSDPTDRLNRVLNMFSSYIGHEVSFNMSVFMSERTTGHRNRAIANLMLNFDMIDGRIDEHLDLYFQQCSLMVTCRDLAMMAATLANRGINPVTGIRAIEECYIRDVLSVMATCGLYDFAGEWAYKVGLPAKSGVSGGIFVTVPRQFGISVFSPPLDERGNSVRGIRVCEQLSRHFGLHVYDVRSGDRQMFGASDTWTTEKPSLKSPDSITTSPSSVVPSQNNANRNHRGPHNPLTPEARMTTATWNPPTPNNPQQS